MSMMSTHSQPGWQRRRNSVTSSPRSEDRDTIKKGDTLRPLAGGDAEEEANAVGRPASLRRTRSGTVRKSGSSRSLVGEQADGGGAGGTSSIHRTRSGTVRKIESSNSLGGARASGNDVTRTRSGTVVKIPEGGGGRGSKPAKRNRTVVRAADSSLAMPSSGGSRGQQRRGSVGSTMGIAPLPHRRRSISDTHASARKVV